MFVIGHWNPRIGSSDIGDRWGRYKWNRYSLSMSVGFTFIPCLLERMEIKNVEKFLRWKIFPCLFCKKIMNYFSSFCLPNGQMNLEIHLQIIFWYFFVHPNWTKSNFLFPNDCSQISPNSQLCIVWPWAGPTSHGRDLCGRAR